LGCFESFDHCGLGSWDPVAEENFMEDGGFGYDAMGFDPFGPEEEQGADQRRDGSLERQQLAAAGFEDEKNQGEDQGKDENVVPYGFEVEATVTEKDKMVDAPLSAWEWGGDLMGLEISTERVYRTAGPEPSSFVPDSTSTIEDTSPSPGDSPALQNSERPSNNDVQSSSASKDANSAGEDWRCDFPNCGKSFTHCHKVK
jgi:hypothetical protein